MSRASDLLNAWGKSDTVDDDVAPAKTELPSLPALPEFKLDNVLGGLGTISLGVGKGGCKPKYDWDAAEKIYVCGETKNGETIFPTIRVLSTRVGCAQATMQGVAAERKWSEKKRAFREGRWIPPQGDPVGNTTKEFVSTKPPKARKKVIANAESILLAYLELFAEAVENKTIKRDSMADLERCVRLLAFVRGQADQRKEVTVTHTLAELTKKHAAVRANARTIEDNEVAGVLSQGDAATMSTTTVMREDGTVVHVAHDAERHDDAAE